MNNKEITRKTGLKKNIIKKNVFDREIELCKKLSKENGGKRNWGVCNDCGVIPLLHKLHKGELLESSETIKRAKNKIIL